MVVDQLLGHATPVTNQISIYLVSTPKQQVTDHRFRTEDLPAIFKCLNQIDVWYLKLKLQRLMVNDVLHLTVYTFISRVQQSTASVLRHVLVERLLAVIFLP